MGLIDWLRRSKRIANSNQPAVLGSNQNIQTQNNILQRKKPNSGRFSELWRGFGNMGNQRREGAVKNAKQRLSNPHYDGKYALSTNQPRKGPTLNLQSKEARMKEMQKRRASLKPVPKAPFGRR